MAHGYLGDGYGSHGDIGPDSGDRRDRDMRERNSRGDDQDWRSRGHDRDRSGRYDRDRSGGMMFGSRDRDWSGGDRWSSGDDRHEGYWNEGYRRDHGFGDFQRRHRGDEEWGTGQRQFGASSGSSQGGRRPSAHPDDHYRSWRDRHMSELDRDYEDYCREREQAFHQEFDAWRMQRHGNPQPLRTGMTQTGMSHDPSGELQLTTEATGDQTGTDAMGEATLGTSTSDATSARNRR
jgi:hypothetical protein